MGEGVRVRRGSEGREERFVGCLTSQQQASVSQGRGRRGRDIAWSPRTRADYCVGKRGGIGTV